MCVNVCAPGHMGLGVCVCVCVCVCVDQDSWGRGECVYTRTDRVVQCVCVLQDRWGCGVCVCVCVHQDRWGRGECVYECVHSKVCKIESCVNLCRILWARRIEFSEVKNLLNVIFKNGDLSCFP